MAIYINMYNIYLALPSENLLWALLLGMSVHNFLKNNYNITESTTELLSEI